MTTKDTVKNLSFLGPNCWPKVLALGWSSMAIFPISWRICWLVMSDLDRPTAHASHAWALQGLLKRHLGCRLRLPDLFANSTFSGELQGRNILQFSIHFVSAAHSPRRTTRNSVPCDQLRRQSRSYPHLRGLSLAEFGSSPTFH